MKVAILTNHLTGTGHFVRSLALADGAGAAGHETLLITGGRPLGHIAHGKARLLQLPPVAVADFDYATLRAPDGAPADARYMAERQAVLTDALRAFGPDVLVTETYPFGRRMLRREYEAALAAVPGARAVASLRDVPEPKPKRLPEVAARLREGYSGVLVHGDAGFLPLSESWPLPGDVASLVRHTGYLGRQMPPAPPERSSEILVAVGGGTQGRALLPRAAAAAGISARPWRLLVGGADAERLAEVLRTAHPAANLTVEPARADYPQLLTSAAATVTLLGYNTFLDLAQCQTPALIVPAEPGGDREQPIRAARLAGTPGITIVAEADITPEILSAKAERLAAGPRRAPLPIACDPGARAAVAVLETLARS